MELKFLHSKKGIFFTLIAVSLLGLAIFSYTATYTYTLQQKSTVTESIIESMDKFLDDMEKDMQNAIYISGFRSILAMEDYIAVTGEFVNDTETAFTEAFINGTVEGTNSTMMENNTFPYWVEKINAQANQAGMNFSVETKGISIHHTTPWTIRIDVNATIKLKDIKNTANWTQNKTISQDISIIGFEDPSYTKYTGSNIFKRINITIYNGNYTNSTSDANLRKHVGKTLYTNFTGAPSFLMRFENDMNASQYGIESFVNKTEISVYHSCPTETSSIDSIYWQCDTGINVWQLENWSGFRIDNETSGNLTRLELYMVEDMII